MRLIDEVGPVAHRLLDADDVLDRVARQRDDHEPDERLRQAQGRHRRPQRLDEPVGDDRRGDARHAASTPIASFSGHASSAGVPIAEAPWPPLSEYGIEAANTTSSTIDTNTEISTGCPLSGPPGAVDTVGIARAAVASTRLIAIVRTGAASNTWRPCLRPPARNASPRTSRLLPRIDPMSAVWVRTTRPSRRANSEMNSSGRLPSADCSTPGRPGPEVAARGCRCPRRRGPRGLRGSPRQRRRRRRRRHRRS